MRRICAFFILLTGAGCELVREPTALDFDRDYLAVHSLLLAGSAQASVLITRATPSDVAFEPHRREPIAGATVRLSNDGHEFILEADPAHPDVCAPQSPPHCV